MIEKVEPTTVSDDGSRRALPIVALIAALALTIGFVLWVAFPASTSTQVGTALTLAGLGVLADLLAFYAQSRSIVGSVSIMPFVAAALLLPDARSVLLIATAQATVEAFRRRQALKLLFNVAQMSAGIGLGVLICRWSAIEPLPVPADPSFVTSVRYAFLPASVVVLTTMLVSTLSVSVIVASISGRPVFRVWLDGPISNLTFAPLHTCLTLYLLWLTVNLGPIGTVGLALPLVAVRQLLKTTAELTLVTEELLDLMVAAIEARDPYTSGHSKRVALGSQIIAKALALKPAAVERVEIAALLHDVGKIDQQFARILSKEGRLSSEEWELMKKHPIRSAELVSMLSSLHDLVPAVRHHHESWDGTGYPDGLKGDAIPLASRIIMFADTLDAITTDRPYRKAMSIEAAKAEFVKFRGKQFDPAICDCVVSPRVWEELYNAFATPRSLETAVSGELLDKAS